MDAMWNEYNNLLVKILSYHHEELNNFEGFEFEFCDTHASGLSSNIWFVVNSTLGTLNRLISVRANRYPKH